MALAGSQIIPAGEVRRAMVLLHGFGSNGADLMGLVAPLEALLPEAERGVTAYFAPDAPLELDFGGRAWFSDNNWTFKDRAGIGAAADAVWAYIEREVLSLGLTAGDVHVFGFSQGAMTALFAAPRWPERVGSVIAHSGRMFWAEELSDDCQKPPVLVLHGEADDVVAIGGGLAAADELRGLGFEVTVKTFDDLGHGVDGRSLAVLGEWLVGAKK